MPRVGTARFGSGPVSKNLLGLIRVLNQRLPYSIRGRWQLSHLHHNHYPDFHPPKPKLYGTNSIVSVGALKHLLFQLGRAGRKELQRQAVRGGIAAVHGEIKVFGHLVKIRPPSLIFNFLAPCSVYP